MMSKEKRRVPKLRFPGFTEDWKQCKFSELYEKISEKNDLSYSLNKIISVANMYYKVDAKVSNEEYLKTYNIFRYGEIAFEGNKSKDFAYGRFVENTIGDGIISHVFEVFRPIAKYDIYFWKYYINYEPIMGKVLSRCTKKTTMMTNLVAKDFLKETVLVPNLAEQKQIGTLLNTLDKFIILHQRKLDHLNLKKKALLQKLFPKNGERYPELRFPGFTDAWEQRKLGDIATFSKGNGYSKSDLVPSGSPIILYGRLYTNYETTIKNVDTFVELKDKSVISQGGEVIVPASGETAEDISRASVVENQGIVIGGDLNVIKVKELLHPTFLALTISNGEQQKELSKRAQGKSVVHLHNSDLQEVNLIFPLFNEQKEISILFEKLDNIITLHQRKLKHLQIQKKSLLQQLFV
ncbi:restriction endonuclease subunit S [uncultured Veillonella sp.]|uniref:restriction endonuclease subunit S n=1 Tax=uncultured Veillonella sp. TaxID=159268 RepID=UPI00260E1620|nr:restriction endonuclease subunit S [uncultured Veillonella sp.]